MHLSVFSTLAKQGAIEKVIIENDRSELRKPATVKIKTVFGDLMPLRTTEKDEVRRFKTPIHALETLSNKVGELTNVKVEFRDK